MVSVEELEVVRVEEQAPAGVEGEKAVLKNASDKVFAAVYL
jgi:hypothetical protein